ncbi:ABC transporter ATP-binding protein [Candidatus Woesearchaeota archaeon]|nr:ABC transporter ATP-binding protein [Candidatus Woesearchaeota archaeon]
MSRKDKYNVDFKENFKIYLSILSKYKGLAFGSLLIVTLYQLIAVSESFIFKSFIDHGEQLSSNVITKEVFWNSILLLLGILAGLLILKAVLVWFRVWFVNKLDTHLIRDMKQKFFKHILYLSSKFHSDKKTGSLISRIIRGTNSIEPINDITIFSMVPILIRFFVLAVTFVFFEVKTAIALLVVSVSFVVYSLYVMGKQKDSQINANMQDDAEKANIADVFGNISTIKYFGKEDKIVNKYNSISNKTRKAFSKFWGYYNWLNAGQNLIMGVGTFFILYFPMRGFLNGEITIGTVAFIYSSYLAFSGLLYEFVHGIRGYRKAMIDFNDLFKYEKIENEIKDIPGAKEIKIKKGVIEFKNVTFSYNNDKIISKLNLVVPENSKVAIVGPSGAGKSTLVKLLYRLYDLDSGNILIDGQDISKVKQESLRSEMSIVPQDAILFDDSIYNNIAFSNPKAGRDEVLKAIKFAQLDKFIARLPKRENTIVGERGVKLSGGERQRVSIARAVLADKKVLVLDEATSSLDSETEHEIQRDLQELMNNRTSIVIAHRLSTIMKADMIIVVEKGRIKEIGSHQELLRNRNGLYRKLWNLQAGSFND